MARLPADEDYARALLSIFQAKNIKTRQSLRIGEVRDAFLRLNMGRPFDFDAALEYAESQRWLSPALGMIRLTGDGDEEMHTVVGFYPSVEPGARELGQHSRKIRETGAVKWTPQ